MTSRLSGDAVLTRRDGLLTTEVDGELLAMSIDDGLCYGLNRVGARVWALMAEPITFDAVCARLLSEFQVQPEVCRAQVEALVDRLHSEGLVTVRAA